MYKIIFISLFTLSAHASIALTNELETNASAQESQAALAQEARQQMRAFGSSLKKTLKAAMREGGPANAMEVCNIDAPRITAAHSGKPAWKVARTSLKLRNPANAPDTWERAVLNSFEQRKMQGESVKKMEHFEVVKQNGKSTFRYMKAIPTAGLCLTCHGGVEIKAPVLAKLQHLYPQDQARGFKAGDIRGAFSLSREIEHSDSHEQ